MKFKLFKKENIPTKVKIGQEVGTNMEVFRGIWYYNQKSHDEYVFKYSGGLGTYCAKHIPFAIYSDKSNKTFFCFGSRLFSKNILVHAVAFYDHLNKRIVGPIALINKKTNDAHDNPVICLDSKGFIWVFSSSHGLSRPSYIFRSCNPFNIDKFICTDVTNFSYPQVHSLPNGKISILLTKYVDGNRTLRSNIIDTYEESPSFGKLLKRNETYISFMEKGHYQISSSYSSKNCEKIDFKVGTAFNIHPEPVGLNARTNLYYLESYDYGNKWVDIFGNKFKQKLQNCENAQTCLVHDYRSENFLVYLKDINFDIRGNPIILYITSENYKSGPAPNNIPRTWTIAHFSKDKWLIKPCFTSDNNYDMGSLYVDEKKGLNIWRIICPSEVGPQPYNPGGEIALWESNDEGKSWNKNKNLTKQSKQNHTYVRRPVNANPEFYAFWADGNPRKKSLSHIYYYNKKNDQVIILPPEK